MYFKPITEITLIHSVIGIWHLVKAQLSKVFVTNNLTNLTNLNIQLTMYVWTLGLN